MLKNLEEFQLLWTFVLKFGTKDCSNNFTVSAVETHGLAEFHGAYYIKFKNFGVSLYSNRKW